MATTCDTAQLVKNEQGNATHAKAIVSSQGCAAVGDKAPGTGTRKAVLQLSLQGAQLPTAGPYGLGRVADVAERTVAEKEGERGSRPPCRCLWSVQAGAVPCLDVGPLLRFGSHVRALAFPLPSALL